jgi:hypothetical protein
MQVESILPGRNATVQCDGYVPMIVRLDGDFQFPPKYWRTGDFKKSLVEIGIDQSSGAICKVTVTSVNGLEPNATQQTELVSLEYGLPCVNPTNWDEAKNRIDVEQDVAASLVGDRFIIRFGSGGAHLVNSVRCGRLVFQIDDDNTLRGIEVADLTQEEIDNLRYATGATAS